MTTHSRPKPESAQLTRQTCAGSILRAPGVSVMSIRNKQTQSAPTPTGKDAVDRVGRAAADGAESYKQTQFDPDRPEGTPAGGAGKAAAGGTELYKQTQFARGDVKGQVLCGKRVMTNWRRQGPGENKANPRHQADGSAARQSATARRGTQLRIEKLGKGLAFSVPCGTIPSLWLGSESAGHS